MTFVDQWYADNVHSGRQRQRKYTPQDDAILRSMAGKATIAEIAERLGRTEFSIRTRAFNMQLSLAKSTGFHWTPEQIGTLRRLAPTHTAAEIGEIIGRTAAAVQTAANRRGIALLKYGESHFRSQLTTEQVHQVWQMRRQGMYVQEIADQLGVKYNVVRSIVEMRTRYREVIR